MKFADLRLAEPLLNALAHEGYEIPTPIQAQSIPPILEGRDLMGCAQTGTGKTAAFSLPLLQRIMIESATAPRNGGRRHCRALILSPTRELASQIAQSIRAYGGKTGVRYAVIFGGVGQGPQVDAIRSGVDVLVATPGRLIDLMNQRLIDLSHVEIFVLDEADRMLDMGFINDIRKVIAKLPDKRQNLMFSATMPPEIKKLADSLLHNPAYVQIAPVAATADLIEQYVYHVKRGDKPALLSHLYEAAAMSRVLVFTRTKHGADRVVRKLYQDGIHAEAIHGNKSQNARQRALGNFKSGKTAVLVATDIAARGLDVDDVSHVVNYDIPHEPETYVHRIGRTGRAGASGIALSFCDGEDEKTYLRDIEKLLRKRIDVKNDHPTYEKTVQSRPAHAPRETVHHKPSHPRAQRHADQTSDHRRAEHPKPDHTRQDRRPQHAAPRHDGRPLHGGPVSHPVFGVKSASMGKPKKKAHRKGSFSRRSRG